MSRAQQTISIALLVSSVRDPSRPYQPSPAQPSKTDRRAKDKKERQDKKTNRVQVYLCLYLELIPLPAVVQRDIVPVVRCIPP